MAETQRSGKTVIGLLQRRWPWIVATVAAFVAVADLLALAIPRTYEASALMVIDQRATSPTADLNAATSTGQLLAAHYIKMATSSLVLDAVCADPAGSCTTASLKNHVTGTTVKGTDLLAFKVTDANADRAASLANLLSLKLINEARREVATALKPTTTYLDGELNRLSHDISTAKPPLLSVLQSQYTTAYARREAVAEQEARLDGALSIVQQAAAPASPADPRPNTYLLAGFVAGLVAALIIALVMERVDTRIFETRTLSDATAAPLVVAC